MRFFSAVVPTILFLASGAQAWAQDPSNGVWVANHVIYKFDNGEYIHEGCTKRNTVIVNRSGPCAYWIPGASGTMHKGNCGVKPGMVICW